MVEQLTSLSWQTFSEAVPDGVVLVDRDGLIAAVNGQAERMFGYAREELLGQSVDILVPERLRMEHAGYRAGYAAHPHDRPMGKGLELVARRKDGGEVLVEISLSQMATMSGGYTLAVVRDISERKQAEAVLRASELRFRSLVESAPDAIVIADEGGIIRSWNRAAQHMFGYQEEEVVGKPVTMLMPERYRGQHTRGLERVRATGETKLVGAISEVEGLHKDGREFPIESSLAMWRSGGGMFFSGIIRNITERKRWEGILLEVARGVSLGRGEAFFRSLVEHLARALEVDFAFVGKLAGESTDIVRTVAFWAQGELAPNFDYHLAHTPCETVVGRASCTYPHSIRRQFPLDHLLDEMNIESYAGAPLWDSAGRPLGLLVAMSCRPLRNPQTVDAMLRIFAVRAATEIERARAEEALRASEAQLRQSQKMEAVGRLAGGIAHDFNNLLAIMTGCGETLLRRLRPEDPLRRYPEEIKEAGARAAGLTSQLLAFSRPQVHQTRRLDLNEVVANMETLLRRLIGEHIELFTTLGSGLDPVQADPSQLEQVILNLAVNARDAMPQAGRLTIGTANVAVSGTGPHLQAIPPGRYARLAVSDTGCGMDAETQARIFEPFFTTKPQGKGSGLGLSIIYGIVKQSHGHVFVDSEPGRGSTFTIYLPCVGQAGETLIASAKGNALRPQGR